MGRADRGVGGGRRPDARGRKGALAAAAGRPRGRLSLPDRRAEEGGAGVGAPHQARGRSFRVVFVPGLAERVVPQRPREDPLLLDERRRSLNAALGARLSHTSRAPSSPVSDTLLVQQDERGSAERLLLKI